LRCPGCGAPTSRTPGLYDDVIRVLENLPEILRVARRRRALTLAEAGGQIGVVASTYRRWEQGAPVCVSTPRIAALLRWAAADHEVEVVREPGEPPEDFQVITWRGAGAC
jgi:transcriptional regulator with XRE-family HTH domain